MKNSIFVIFLLGLSFCQGVFGEDEHLIKKTVYPYMAFIYYSDPSVKDATGARFIRSAVLIRNDWLVTSALGPSIIDNGFPEKTLLARVGAVTIDVNFSLNADEDEQEQEVIQIVRPYNHSATQWWTTDISLVKTLLPFLITPAVDTKTINLKRNFVEKTCSILVYAKYANYTDKVLMQLFVELLPPTMDNCGKHFSGGTMICATGADDNKEISYEPDFCQGNSGGPLICESEIMGLQTYIGNNCEAPHLYQLLSSWDNFITCGIEDKCQEEHCANICDVTYKDPPKAQPTMRAIGLIETTTEDVTVRSPTIPTIITGASESVTREDFMMTSTVLVTMEETEGTEATTTTTKRPTTVTSYTETTETVLWPQEQTEDVKKMVEDVRTASVEAQQEGKQKSAAARNMCFVQTAFFGLVLKCLF